LWVARRGSSWRRRATQMIALLGRSRRRYVVCWQRWPASRRGWRMQVAFSFLHLDEDVHLLAGVYRRLALERVNHLQDARVDALRVVACQVLLRDHVGLKPDEAELELVLGVAAGARDCRGCRGDAGGVLLVDIGADVELAVRTHQDQRLRERAGLR